MRPGRRINSSFRLEEWYHRCTRDSKGRSRRVREKEVNHGRYNRKNEKEFVVQVEWSPGNVVDDGDGPERKRSLDV